MGVPIQVRPSPGTPLALYAYATKDGSLPSSMVHCVYAVNMCRTPMIVQLVAGKLSMETETDSAEIRYTLDGSEPDQSSSVWDPADPVTLNMDSTEDQLVRARAFKENLVPSIIAVLRVSIGQVIRPQIFAVEGSPAHDQYSIATATSDANIEYAIKRFPAEHTPTRHDTYEWISYNPGSVISIDRLKAGNIAIVARASKSEMVTSDVVILSVVVEKLSPPDISRDALTLILDTNDADVEIQFSLENQGSWEVYNPSDRPQLDISAPGQIVYNARAMRLGHETSEVATSIIIVQQAPIPTINFTLDKLNLHTDPVQPPWQNDPVSPVIYYTVNGPTPNPRQGARTLRYDPSTSRQIDTDGLTELSIKAVTTCEGFANSNVTEHMAERVGGLFCGFLPGKIFLGF